MKKNKLFIVSLIFFLFNNMDAQTNEERASQMINNTYKNLLEWNTSSFSWIGLTSITSDEADKGSSPGDTGSDKDKLDNLDFNADTPSLEGVWRGIYNGIELSNKTIYYMDHLNIAKKNQYKGEAKFLRAVYYFNLVRLYGDVPIYKYDINDTYEVHISKYIRRPKAEVYAYIESDLTDAIALLPSKENYSGNDIGRASKGAALGLMAKVKLYQQKWQEVIDYANQITGYGLAPSYADMFKKEGENNIESLFEIQSTSSDGSDFTGIMQYTQVQGARGTGGWGWGFNTPSANLVNSYESSDVRKNATIIFRGTTLYDGRLVPNTVENPRYNYKAYNSGHPELDQSDVNIRVLRYAEVLLMKAEALNELNQPLLARDYVNQIRLRANLLPVNYTSQLDIRLAIRKERKFELAMEHDRWFDIIRTGQAQSVMQNDGKVFQSYYNVFPIPRTIITESGGLTTPNPGY